MPKGTAAPYSEELLHWLWQTMRFSRKGLRTANGQKVVIFDQGLVNDSDGPDFHGCKIQIGDLTFYGDVEIHWSIQDWNHHDHQSDERYNRVILHVVWETPNGTQNTASRQDGTTIPVLPLKPYVSQPLASFLRLAQKENPSSLPCADNLRFISREAFRRQIERAHKEYFEQKIDDLFSYYDPALTPSRAWLKMVSVGLSDGLGVTHNREPMRKLCNDVFALAKNISSRSRWMTEVASIAFDHSSISGSSYDWKRKGSRPANHPENRVEQMASIIWVLNQLPFDHWLTRDPEMSWQALLEQSGCFPGGGTQRTGILLGTVWLPANYLMGQLFGSRQIQDTAYEAWQKHETNLPKSLLEPFRQLDEATGIYENKLGSIYQLRSYCRPHRCASCEVFKDAISS